MTVERCSLTEREENESIDFFEPIPTISLSSKSWEWPQFDKIKQFDSFWAKKPSFDFNS